MARVERGNVVLKVEDYEVQRYLNLGYNLTDDDGNILKASIPTSLGDLQAAYLKHTARIEELERAIAQLTAENQELKATKTVKTETTKRTSKKKAE